MSMRGMCASRRLVSRPGIRRALTSTPSGSALLQPWNAVAPAPACGKQNNLNTEFPRDSWTNIQSLALFALGVTVNPSLDLFGEVLLISLFATSAIYSHR